MVDCKHPERGWISGKIVDKEILPFSYEQNLKVIHKISNTRLEYSYQVTKNVISYFPSQSYKNCEHFHLKLVQRVFSEAHNQMLNCNIPLVISLPSWMRYKEFHYLVYTQIKRFISSHFTFQEDTFPTNYISSNFEKTVIREATKTKVKKFK